MPEQRVVVADAEGRVPLGAIPQLPITKIVGLKQGGATNALGVAPSTPDVGQQWIDLDGFTRWWDGTKWEYLKVKGTADLNTAIADAVARADAASTKADAASTKADAANTLANSAKDTADGVAATANAANATASAARDTANSAASAAGAASAKADAASDQVATITTRVNQAASDASTALTTANTAKTTADGVAATASAADTKATQAATDASTALTAANSVQATADAARTAATAAETKATAAQTTANQAASDVSSVTTQAANAEQSATAAAASAAAAQTTATAAQTSADQAATAAQAVTGDIANLTDSERRLEVTNNLINNSEGRDEWTGSYGGASGYASGGGASFTGPLEPPVAVPIGANRAWKVGDGTSKRTQGIWVGDTPATAKYLAGGVEVMSPEEATVEVAVRLTNAQGGYVDEINQAVKTIPANTWTWVSTPNGVPEVSAGNRGSYPGLVVKAQSPNTSGNYPILYVRRPTAGVGGVCNAPVLNSHETHALATYPSIPDHNAGFDLWRSNESTPTGYGSLGDSSLLRRVDETSGGRRVGMNVSGSSFTGVWTTNAVATLPTGLSAATVSIDLVVKSGTLSGAGVVLKISGTTTAGKPYMVLPLKDFIPSPIAGKRYTVSTTILRDENWAGSQTGWRLEVRANPDDLSADLGAGTAKDIEILSVKAEQGRAGVSGPAGAAGPAGPAGESASWTVIGPNDPLPHNPATSTLVWRRQGN